MKNEVKRTESVRNGAMQCHSIHCLFFYEEEGGGAENAEEMENRINIASWKRKKTWCESMKEGKEEYMKN